METQNTPYPIPQDNNPLEVPRMPKRKYQLPETKEPFGKRLARLRKAAGHSQYTLADETGISNRMIAYYETHHHPPTHVLPIFAKVLGITTDQLLGVEKVKKAKGSDSRLRRLLEEVEQLPPVERKHIAKSLENSLAAWKMKNGKT
jgi:transcriptional regulator with XRE-family HTH domain